MSKTSTRKPLRQKKSNRTKRKSVMMTTDVFASSVTMKLSAKELCRMAGVRSDAEISIRTGNTSRWACATETGFVVLDFSRQDWE